jgi:hypothetical protein
MENETAAESSPTGDRPSGWFAFNEKPVMLQLVEPYIGCTFAYQPTMSEDGSGVRATPVLSGVLYVEPDGNGGIMLAIRMQLEGSDFCLVAVNPKIIHYCTHLHQSRIVSP